MPAQLDWYLAQHQTLSKGFFASPEELSAIGTAIFKVLISKHRVSNPSKKDWIYKLKERKGGWQKEGGDPLETDMPSLKLTTVFPGWENSISSSPHTLSLVKKKKKSVWAETVWKCKHSQTDRNYHKQLESPWKCCAGWRAMNFALWNLTWTLVYVHPYTWRILSSLGKRYRNCGATIYSLLCQCRRGTSQSCTLIHVTRVLREDELTPK